MTGVRFSGKLQKFYDQPQGLSDEIFNAAVKAVEDFVAKMKAAKAEDVPMSIKFMPSESNPNSGINFLIDLQEPKIEGDEVGINFARAVQFNVTIIDPSQTANLVLAALKENLILALNEEIRRNNTRVTLMNRARNVIDEVAPT